MLPFFQKLKVNKQIKLHLVRWNMYLKYTKKEEENLLEKQKKS